MPNTAMTSSADQAEADCMTSNPQERPILYQGAMVRGILADVKTQTRRLVKVKPSGPHSIEEIIATPDSAAAFVRQFCPYGKPGDRLWVRETWARNWNQLSDTRMDRSYVYRADGETRAQDNGTDLPWKPSIHMPRWASRILLEITEVRVQRLQDISEEDAIAEGCEARPFPGPWWQGYRDVEGELMHFETLGEAPPDWMIEPKRMKDMTHMDRSAKDAFCALWEQINGSGSWDLNPHVWAISFRRINPPTPQGV